MVHFDRCVTYEIPIIHMLLARLFEILFSCSHNLDLNRVTRWLMSRARHEENLSMIHFDMCPTIRSKYVISILQNFDKKNLVYIRSQYL